MLTAVKKHMKIIKTGNTYISFFMLALSQAVTGPCLLDLQHLVRTDAHHIAFVYTCRSIGYLFGAILGGILLDVAKSKQAVLVVCHAVATGTMFGIPWIKNIDTMMGIMAVNGLSLGALETGGNVMCLHLWGKDSGPFYQGLQFVYGLGAVLAPLIAAPFLEVQGGILLSRNNENHLEGDPLRLSNASATYDNITRNTTYIKGNLLNSIDIHSIYHNPQIVYPFSIVGAFGLLVTVLILIACIISPTEDGQVQEKEDNSEKSFLFLFFSILFTFLLFFVAIGSEIAYGQTLTAYAVEGPLHATTSQGSYMTSAFWSTLTLARLASVFLVMRFSNLVLMMANVCIVAVTALVLQFCMPNEWALWLASVLFGAGIGSWYASLVGYLNAHILVTSKIAAIFSVGLAAGDMALPFTAAYFIDSKPEVFTLIVAAASVLMPVLLFVLYFIFKTGSRSDDCCVTDGALELGCYETGVTMTKF